MKILLIGPFPLPRGGIAEHLKRLAYYLKTSGHTVYCVDESSIVTKEIYNIRSLNLFYYLKLIFASEVIHVQSALSLTRVFHILLGKVLKKKIVVTIHSWRSQSLLNFFVQKNILKLVDKVICVNNEIAQALKCNNYVVIPAFLPPILNKEKPLQKEIADWIKDRKRNHDIILAGNAFRLDEYKGVDIYGLDLCIKLMDQLINKESLNVSLVFTVASLKKSERKYSHYQDEIKKRGLEDYILLTHGDIPFVRIITESDIVLRPTNTDGDALTIREALHLGCQIIASDVVDRPEGTILFKNRDINDFIHVTQKTIENNLHKNKRVNSNKDCHILAYEALYNEVFKNKIQALEHRG